MAITGKAELVDLEVVLPAQTANAVLVSLDGNYVPSQPEASRGEAAYEPRRFWRLGPVTQVS